MQGITETAIIGGHARRSGDALSTASYTEMRFNHNHMLIIIIPNVFGFFVKQNIHWFTVSSKIPHYAYIPQSYYSTHVRSKTIKVATIEKIPSLKAA